MKQAGVRATAFGLDVYSELALSFLEGSVAEPTGRTLELSMEVGDALDANWPASAVLVCDEHLPDGSVLFQIEAHPEAGFLIFGPRYGAYLLSSDGLRLRCAPAGRPDDVWQRFLIAQVLPFAALLRGLEVFHASAIVHDGKAVALIGPSHAGKTSLALELCRRGATFLTDDVLAVERVGEDLLGYPGTPVAGLDHSEAQRIERAEGAQRHEIVASNPRERVVRMRGATEPASLGALFILDRGPGGPSRPSFELASEPRLLLAATFNSVITAPSRLRGLLDICALAARLPVERILAGPDVDAAELASAIERRLGAAP